MMKKYFIIYILLSIALSITLSCSKSKIEVAPSQNTRTVIYSFTTGVTGNYSLAYANSEGNVTLETITGASWSKTVNYNDTKITGITLAVTSRTIVGSVPVNLKITLNNSVVSSATANITDMNSTAFINYTF